MPEGISILGERYSIDIILMVYEKPGMNKTEIVRSVPSGQSTRSARIDELIEAGILETAEGEHWRGIYITLTEKGIRIAKHLAEINSIFSE